MFGNVVETAGLRFLGHADKYADDMFENMDTGYAEVCSKVENYSDLILILGIGPIVYLHYLEHHSGLPMVSFI